MHDLARSDRVENTQHIEHLWSQVVNVVARCPDNHQRQIEPLKVLLMWDALVYGQKHVECTSRKAEKGAILRAGSTHLSHRLHIVLG